MFYFYWRSLIFIAFNSEVLFRPDFIKLNIISPCSQGVPYIHPGFEYLVEIKI